MSATGRFRDGGWSIGDGQQRRRRIGPIAYGEDQLLWHVEELRQTSSGYAPGSKSNALSSMRAIPHRPSKREGRAGDGDADDDRRHREERSVEQVHEIRPDPAEEKERR